MCEYIKPGDIGDFFFTENIDHMAIEISHAFWAVGNGWIAVLVAEVGPVVDRSKVLISVGSETDKAYLIRATYLYLRL